MIYRVIMKIAHRFNWHYAPPIYPEGDTVLWCKWCGFRERIKIRTRTIEELQSILDSEDEVKILVNRDGSIST